MPYPSYPNYIESNIEWFGSVPSDWNKLRLKWTVTTCKNGVWGAEPDGENDIYCIRVADFERVALNVSDKNLTVRAVAMKDRKGRLLQKGDLLLEKSGGGESQLVGAVSLFDLEVGAVCSNFVALMQCDTDHDSRYLNYLHSHLYSCRVNYRSIKQSTGIQNLDSLQYLNEFVFLPDIKIQTAIVKFLDLKTRQIDQLIEKKKALIEKLDEQRIAVITQAVTKGVDKNAKMKPSGVDWLGDIPEHWVVNRLKFVGKAIIGLTYSPSDVCSESSGILVLRSSNIQNGKMVNNDNTYVSTDVVEKLITKADDILICSRNGSRELIGKNARVEDDFIGVTFGAFTTVFRSQINSFLFYVFNSSLFKFQSGRYLTSTINQLTIGAINTFEVPIPPDEERAQIISFLSDKLDKNERAVSLNKRLIEKLQEYRSSLIANAVTGKIDVRDIPAKKGSI